MRHRLARGGDTWSVLVILRLHERGIDSVSRRTLSLTLRNLARTATPSLAPRVDYEPTALGHSLAVPVDALGAFAFAYFAGIDAAQP